MSMNNFIPQVWSARLLENLRKAHVYAQESVINRDYEGEIRDYGDSVRINTPSALNIFTYTKNADMPAPEVPASTTQTLVIDQAQGFNFAIDDIDAVQQRPKVMDAYMREAAYALADTLDRYLANLHTQVATANSIGAPGTPRTDAATAGRIYDYLTELGVLLDQANVPSTGRWCILPPWAEALLRRDQRFVGTGGAMAEATLRNGEVGQAAGFTIYKSNNVAFSGNEFYILAGTPIAWTLAVQISKVEAYRPERRFADAVKGLMLYGARVTRPTALARLVLERPAA